MGFDILWDRLTGGPRSQWRSIYNISKSIAAKRIIAADHFVKRLVDDVEHKTNLFVRDLIWSFLYSANLTWTSFLWDDPLTQRDGPYAKDRDAFLRLSPEEWLRMVGATHAAFCCIRFDIREAVDDLLAANSEVFGTQNDLIAELKTHWHDRINSNSQVPIETVIAREYERCLRLRAASYSKYFVLANHSMNTIAKTAFLYLKEDWMLEHFEKDIKASAIS